MPNWVNNRLTISGENADKIMESICTTNENGELIVDFNKIIPMPEALHITSGTETDRSVELYLIYINPEINYYGNEENGINKLSIQDFTNILISLGKNEESFIRKMQGERYPGICKYRRNLTSEEIENFLAHGLDEKTARERGRIAVENVLKYGSMTWYDWSNENWGVKWNASDCTVDANQAYFSTPWGSVGELMLKLSEKFPDNEFQYEYAEEQGGLYAADMIIKNGNIIEGGAFEENTKEAWEKYFDLFGGEEDYVFNELLGTYEFIDSDSELEM